MKSVVNTQDKKVMEHPYIGRSKLGNTVLFTWHNTGFVLSSSSNLHEIGYFTTAWCEVDFAPLSGEVVLSND